MSKRVVVVIVACMLPALASAQTVEELQAKIKALLEQIKVLQDKIAGAPLSATPAAGTPASGCPVLVRTLGVGARGDDVVALQRFLKEQGFFKEETTGYFGSITEAAVRSLQAAHGLVSSGDARTTGYGLAGPRTRALIAELCQRTPAEVQRTAPSVSAATSTMLSCPLIASLTAPGNPCTGNWVKLMSLGCHVGWRCNLSGTGTNKPPVVTSVEGPTTLDIGAFGSWRINAVDPEQSALSYRITWGDEGALDILSALAGLGGTFTSSPTAIHAYAKAGTFTLNVSVRDSAGQETSAIYSVVVSAGAVSAPSSFLPPVATTTVSASCITPWGAQVVHHLGWAYWQPFFTDGLYFSGTSTPVMRCDNGSWLKCDGAGANCQAYKVATSTASGSLPSYTGIIGTPCPHYGATMKVSVPPGTQLCQWLSCTVVQEVQTVTLKCEHSGWVDTSPFRGQQIQ